MSTVPRWTLREIAKLADLESREVLLGKLAGAMLASLSQAVYLLNAPLAQAARLVGALEAKAEQDPSILKGGAGEPAAPAEAIEDTATEAPSRTLHPRTHLRPKTPHPRTPPPRLPPRTLLPRTHPRPRHTTEATESTEA